MASAANPSLRPEGTDEGINASDPEMVEIDGSTYLYFAVGDQLTWMNIKRAVFPDSTQSFFESWYTQPGIPDQVFGRRKALDIADGSQDGHGQEQPDTR